MTRPEEITQEFLVLIDRHLDDLVNQRATNAGD